MQREKLTPRAQEMYSLIEKYFTTDLNQKTFCKQEGIAYSTFHWWLAQYRQNRSAQAVSNNKNADDFLPIHVTPPKLSGCNCIVTGTFCAVPDEFRTPET